MDIRLNKLTIENFKGITKFEVELNGKNACIKAENGIGKTTVYDAFLWLLFGKNSEEKKDFGIRPLDSKNNPIKGLDVAVEAKLAYDGQVHTFRKEHHEKVVKNQIRGYETLCWIDEVPKLIGQYTAYIAEIIAEDTFKMLTDLTHFNSKLHWSDRRNALIDIAGALGTPEGFEELIDALNGREVKDYKKVLTDRKNLYKKNAADNKAFIKERIKGWAGHIVTDTESIEKKRETLEGEIDKLDKKREKLFKSQQERQAKVDHLNAIKTKKIERETELKNDTSSVKALLEEKNLIEVDHSTCESAVTKAESNIKSKQQVIVLDENTNLANCLRNKQEIREEYNKLKAAKEDETCFACGQTLTGEKLELAKDVKKQKLAEIADRGNKAMAMHKGCKERIERLKSDLNDLKGVLDKAKDQLVTITKHRALRFKELNEGIKNNITPLPEQDEYWNSICAEIAKAETEIGEPVADQMQAIYDSRNVKVREHATLNDALKNADQAKKDEARIKELEDKEKELAQKIADTEKELKDIENYEAAESKLIEMAVNGKFKHVEFKLFKELLTLDDNNGEKKPKQVPCCEAIYNGTPYPDMSTGEKIYVGIDIVNVLSAHYGVSVPMFLDHRESLTLPIETETQVISLVAEKGVKKLQVTIEN